MYKEKLRTKMINTLNISTLWFSVTEKEEKLLGMTHMIFYIVHVHLTDERFTDLMECKDERKDEEKSIFSRNKCWKRTPRPNKHHLITRASQPPAWCPHACSRSALTDLDVDDLAWHDAISRYNNFDMTSTVDATNKPPAVRDVLKSTSRLIRVDDVDGYRCFVMSRGAKWKTICKVAAIPTSENPWQMIIPLSHFFYILLCQKADYQLQRLMNMDDLYAISGRFNLVWVKRWDHQDCIMVSSAIG